MSYIDAIRAARDEPSELSALIEAASLILCKFTEGEEDWSEWIALQEALEPYVIDDRLTSDVRFKLIIRLDEFADRRLPTPLPGGLPTPLPNDPPDDLPEATGLDDVTPLPDSTSGEIDLHWPDLRRRNQ